MSEPRLQEPKEGYPPPPPTVPPQPELCVSGLLSAWSQGELTASAPPRRHPTGQGKLREEEQDELSDGMAGPQTCTQCSVRGACVLQKRKPSARLPEVARGHRAPAPASALPWGAVTGLRGARDQIPGGFAGLPQLLPLPSTTSPPILPREGDARAWWRCRAPPPPAFVAVRIPMLPFLTGHWWLYRQVLRRACNYPGPPGLVLPASPPQPSARALPESPLWLLRYGRCGGREPALTPLRSIPKFPLLMRWWCWWWWEIPAAPRRRLRNLVALDVPCSLSAHPSRMATPKPGPFGEQLSSFPSRQRSWRPSWEAFGRVEAGNGNVQKLIVISSCY